MIELQNLSKTFQSNGKDVKAVDSVSLTVNEGEICVFLGPSGCGKSTTLKMINRLIKPTSGKILINGEDTTDLDPVTLRRNIGYVIQQIGLFPNMTIEENITVVPRLLGWDKQKCHERARELMSMIKLEPKQYLHRYPRELSGGQQQRIGVIRALAADAPLLLMDEPFGAVDPINREMIQNEFFEMQRALNKTVIMVSHDIDEAIKLGDQIAIFRAGKLLQIDHPDTLLAHPAAHVEPLKVDYAYAGYVNIAAFSKTNVERGIIFSGMNGDGQKGRMIIPRISLAMSGDFGWITDEASELTLGGQALYVPELQSDADFGPFMRIDLMPDLPI